MKDLSLKRIAIAICGLILVIIIVTNVVRHNNQQREERERQEAAAAAQVKKEADAKALQAIAADMKQLYGGNIGLVIVDLSNGASVQLNQDAPFVSASIYKLYVAYGIYQLIDDGKLALNDSLAKYGINNTVEHCLNIMITISDNPCAQGLGRHYGWAKLDEMLQQNGYTSTVLNNYNSHSTVVRDKYTTAYDTALLLRRLYNGKLLSKSSTDAFITSLKASKIDYMLPSGLPDDTVVANKVGFLDEYQHDAGIIYSPKKNVLVVMLTKGWESAPASEASEAFSDLGEQIWKYTQQ